MAKISGLGYNEQALRLCIEGMDGGRVWGRVVSMRLSAPIEFEDLSDFVVKIDAVMDEQNFPQAFQRKRGFKKSGGGREESIRRAIEGRLLTEQQVAAERGSRATIDIRVLTRQNASWQGNAVLEGRARPVDFSSDLELIQIITEYLGEAVPAGVK